MSQHEHGNPDEQGHVHIVPPRLLVAVWGALMVLTVVTVAVAQFDFGDLNIVIALAIAAVKASLVVLYFMHMRWERPFNAILLVGSILFVALLIAIALMDATMYKPDLIPGYAPMIENP